MEKLRRYIRIEKAIILCILTAIFLIDLCCVFFYGIDVLNIVFFLIDIGMIILNFHPVTGNFCCWIEIRGAEIYLLNFKGEILRFSAGDIIKVVYGFMFYRLYFWKDGKQVIIQCHPRVKVSKNGKKHRGIWLEDFPQAKFEDK